MSSEYDDYQHHDRRRGPGRRAEDQRGGRINVNGGIQIDIRQVNIVAGDSETGRVIADTIRDALTPPLTPETTANRARGAGAGHPSPGARKIFLLV